MRLTGFHNRVAIQTIAGNHLRYVPGSLAQAMVAAGSALPAPASGKIRAVAIARPASTCAIRIGEPSAPSFGVRFHRWVRLDESASRIVEYHPRSWWI